MARGRQGLCSCAYRRCAWFSFKAQSASVPAHPLSPVQCPGPVPVPLCQCCPVLYPKTPGRSDRELVKAAPPSLLATRPYTASFFNADRLWLLHVAIGSSVVATPLLPLALHWHCTGTTHCPRRRSCPSLLSSCRCCWISLLLLL